MGDSPRHQDAAEVAAEAARSLWLPEVCFVPDLSAAFGREGKGMHAGAVRRLILRGDLGPYGRLGRRLYVLRASLLQHLAERAALPERPSPRALPRPRPDLVEALTPRPRRGRGRR